jgi:hypothetical protein
MTLNLGAAIAHIASIRADQAQHTGCPEWDHGGIRAALIATEGAPADVSAAACLAAGDPKLQKPSAAAFRAHWPKNAKAQPRVSMNVPCVDHPAHDMPCPHPSHGGDMTPEQIAQLKAEALELAATNPYIRPEVRRARAQGSR